MTRSKGYPPWSLHPAQPPTMRFLITMQPSEGHFHPLVPVADELRRAGHEVVFACGRPFCRLVQANGFRCHPAGLDDFSFRHARAEPMVVDLLRICDLERPHAILRDVAEFGGCIAAEYLGLPHASVQVGTHCPPEPPWDLVGVELSRARAAFGLDGEPTFAMLYRYLHLSSMPPSFQRLGGFRPATTQTVRPVVFDESGPESLPSWMGHLPPRPVVYLSMGTVVNRPDVLQRLVVALRILPVTVIMTVGRDHDPAAFRPAPPNVHIERYIPQSLLFPRCDLVVTHGGYNTVLAALANGLPMVVVPIFSDQPENARRCEALGLARVVRGPLPPAEEIAQVASSVLSDPSYAYRANQVRREIEHLPGPDHAVALVERMVMRAA